VVNIIITWRVRLAHVGPAFVSGLSRFAGFISSEHAALRHDDHVASQLRDVSDLVRVLPARVSWYLHRAVRRLFGELLWVVVVVSAHAVEGDVAKCAEVAQALQARLAQVEFIFLLGTCVSSQIEAIR